MTCIVAVKNDGKVFMGADSAGVAGYGLVCRNDPKIYIVGDFMFGFTSSFRMGQLLGYSFIAPDHDPRISIEKFMATDFINAVRTCLKNGGFARKDNEEELAGTFLVGYKGRLFHVCDDYQVGESIHEFDAVGCGQDIALGSLFSTKNMDMKLEERLQLSLLAAQEFSAGVRAPFIIKSN